jgi:hypothetical protein
MQENGGSEQEMAAAMARAHERMLQAELASSQAGPSQVPQPQQRPPAARDARAAEDASRAAGARQAAQLRALSRLEVCCAAWHSVGLTTNLQTRPASNIQ